MGYLSTPYFFCNISKDTHVSPNSSPYRTVSYLNQTLETNFSKITRLILKFKLYSDRVRLYKKIYLIFIFLEQFFINRSSKFDQGMVRRQVRGNRCILHKKLLQEYHCVKQSIVIWIILIFRKYLNIMLEISYLSEVINEYSQKINTRF